MSNETIIIANIFTLIVLAIYLVYRLNKIEDKINDLNLIICYLVDPETAKKVTRIEVKKD